MPPAAYRGAVSSHSTVQGSQVADLWASLWASWSVACKAAPHLGSGAAALIVVPAASRQEVEALAGQPGVCAALIRLKPRPPVWERPGGGHEDQGRHRASSALSVVLRVANIESERRPLVVAFFFRYLSLSVFSPSGAAAMSASVVGGVVHWVDRNQRVLVMSINHTNYLFLLDLPASAPVERDGHHV